MRPSSHSAVRLVAAIGVMLAWSAVPCLAQLSFTAPLEFPAGFNADAIVTADFNHDGRVDVAVLNAGTGQVSVILGGGGLFQPPLSVFVGPLIAAVTAGDFNRDGHADLAVATPNIFAVAILLGHGDGTFQPPSYVPMGFPVQGLAVGDFDEDLIDDVVAAGGASLRVIKGATSGSFAALSTIVIPIPGFDIPAHSIVAADLNGDGHTDVAVGGVLPFTGVLVTYLGTGSGALVAGQFVPVLPFSSSSLAVGDFNKDGRPDIAVAGIQAGGSNPFGFGPVAVCYGTPNGSYLCGPMAFGVHPSAIASADFDGDGVADLAVTYAGDPSIPNSSLVRVLLGSRTASMSPGVDIPLLGLPAGVVAIDVTSDAKPDLLVTTGFRNTLAVLINQSQHLQPIADAGPDSTVPERTLVALDASQSRDPNGLDLTYQWTQTAGTPVVLSLADVANPTFTAPEVTLGGASLTFALVVSNGTESASDNLNIFVANVNRPPSADAGPDQAVNEGAIVVLDGSRSFDLDGDQLYFTWNQVDGPHASLVDPYSPLTTFPAFEVDRSGATLTFDLDVFDGFATTIDRVVVVINNINRPPVANAGPDQSVNEGDVVSFDGSASQDPDADPLTYHWTQLAGPAVVLNYPDTAYPNFTPATVPAGGATLTFMLTVNDDPLTDSDTVNVIVKNINRPPVADAGPLQAINEGSLVTLDGANSFDPDGETLSYFWTQTAGLSVVLSDRAVAKPTFTAPQVGFSGDVATFLLTISDGIDGASDSVTVVVENVNHPPIANAGPDQTRAPGARVTLDGTGSSDPDHDPLAYSWRQTVGTPVAWLTVDEKGNPAPVGPSPSFIAPSGNETLEFELTVNDGLDKITDSVAITIQNISDPPRCDLARPTIPVLWPPDHRLIPLAITGVSDPNNLGVVITVDGVTQDEPVDGLGDGDTSPDAVLHESAVLLRAERSGRGNGRVYAIQFTASDELGLSCTGTVRVSVPLSMKFGGSSIDDGQRYDSQVLQTPRR